MPSRWSKGTPKFREAWKATLPVALMSGVLKEEKVPRPPVPGATALERMTGLTLPGVPAQIASRS